MGQETASPSLKAWLSLRENVVRVAGTAPPLKMIPCSAPCLNGSAILHKASWSPDREKYQTSWLYDEWQKFALFRHHPRLGFNCLITGLENSRAYKWWRTRNRGCRRSGAGPDGMTWRYVKDGLLWTLVYLCIFHIQGQTPWRWVPKW